MIPDQPLGATGSILYHWLQLPSAVPLIMYHPVGFPSSLTLPSSHPHFLEWTNLQGLVLGSVFKAKPTQAKPLPLLLLETTSQMQLCPWAWVTPLRKDQSLSDRPKSVQISLGESASDPSQMVNLQGLPVLLFFPNNSLYFFEKKLK